jgi:sterol desaturase/sphingolipid hydroxylase (fatty acid hydroxylase superfamily)
MTLLTNIYLLFINLIIFKVYCLYFEGFLVLSISTVSCIIGLIFIDLLSYCFHYLMHMNKFLWYIHEIHHNSSIYNFTQAFRIHTFELIISYGFKLVFCILFQINLGMIIVYEILALLWGLYIHTDSLRWTQVERLLCRFLTTRQTHKIHHKNTINEQKLNYGMILSIWDYFFKTEYRKPFEELGFKTGLEEAPCEKRNNLPKPVLSRFFYEYKKLIAKTQH